MTPTEQPRQRCTGIPPSHAAGECPWCDDVAATLYVENKHRERLGVLPLRRDDPDLYFKLYGVPAP